MSEDRRTNWFLAKDDVIRKAELWMWVKTHNSSNDHKAEGELFDAVIHMQNLQSRYGTDQIKEWEK